MGGLFSKDNYSMNVLVLGYSKAGATTFLSQDKSEIRETLGYDYFDDRDVSGRRLRIWNPSGNENLISLWPTYYKNAKFQILVFVIDEKIEELMPKVAKQVNYLTNEEELRDCVFIALFNAKRRDADCDDESEMERKIEAEEFGPGVAFKCFRRNVADEGVFEEIFESAIKIYDEKR